MARRNKTSGVRIRKLRTRLSEAQNHRCAYCGKDVYGCGTYDHIIPRCRGGRENLHKGYTRDNVQLVCWWYNVSKQQFSDEEVKRYCQLVVQNNQ